MNFTLAEIISLIKNNGYFISIEGKYQHLLDSKYTLASIKNKIDHGLYYLSNEYISEAGSIFNSVILIDDDKINNPSNIYIKVNNPQLANYKIALSKETITISGIHPTALIDKDAVINTSAHIGPYCIIGKCVIEANVSLLGHITINDNVIIKKNTIIEANSIIGARGMAWIWDEEGERIMQPQLGGVIIEENCILGSDISIVRGSLNENTTIGKGTIIAHGTKIGHGCIVGGLVHMANNVTLAGNANIGERVFLGSGCVVSSNIKIAEGCIIGAGSVVIKSVTEKYATIAGVPGKIINITNFKNKPLGVPKPFKK
jgi:UDP-3-O-[3-hydroxymyristoyl] glucosamine N-acyltransferase